MSNLIKMIQGNSIQHTTPPRQDDKRYAAYLPGFFRSNHMRIGLDEDTLSKHLLLIGGTGTGKTNVFNYLIKDLKQNMTQNDVMIIFDTKGSFYSKFYQRNDIVIGNSKQYANNTEKWNIYKEIVADGWDRNNIHNNAHEITHSIFKDAIEKTTQQFFPNAARDLLASLLIAQIRLGVDNNDFRLKHFYNDKLRNYLDTMSIEKIRDFLKPRYFPDLSSVLMYLGDGSSDQALGVLAELQNVSHQVFLGSFSDHGLFSARNFVRNRGGKTLFVEYDLSLGDTLAPVYRLLFDLCLKEALGREERKESKGNVYLICDEFKLLPNLKHIEDGVNFGREWGVKVIAGLQSIEQLYEIYGENRGRNIASGFSSVITFRPNDTVTREFASNLYGDNIVIEKFENFIGEQKENIRNGKMVEDWDLNGLKTGEAIIGLEGKKPFKYKFDLFGG